MGRVKAINIESVNSPRLSGSRRSSTKVLDREKLIETGLEAFHCDLQFRRLSWRTVHRIYLRTRGYIIWAYEHDLEPSKGHKEDLLAYLADLQDRGLTQGSILAIFVSLNYWFDYLQEFGQVQENPIPYVRTKYLESFKDEIGGSQCCRTGPTECDQDPADSCKLETRQVAALQPTA